MSRQKHRRAERRRAHAARVSRARRTALASAGIAGGAILGLNPAAQAADFTVTNFSDGPLPGPDGSLRKALDDANSTLGDDRILFESTLSGGSLTLTDGQLSITDGVEIEGPGAQIYGPGVVINPLGDSRIFFLDQADATISGLFMSGGVAGDGGAIYADGGDLSIVSSVLNTNRSVGGNGGAVASHNGAVGIYESTISGNRTDGEGGGVWSDEPVTVVASTISGNTAGDSGGGVFADQGGYFYGATISGNISADYGGGIYAGENSFTGEKSYIADSTISGNTAYAGAGVSAAGGADLENTIVTGNKGPPQHHFGDDLRGFFYAAYSLLPSGPAVSVGPNVIVADAQLGPLADNGGPTLTQRPLRTSPAVDKGFAVLAFDQRGLSRPVDIPWVTNALGGDGSDIGAVELTTGEGPPKPTPATPDPQKPKKKKCKKQRGKKGTAAARRCKKKR